MLLAELEVFHSRPGVPTRRVALGHRLLPFDPEPGLGTVLLGAVAYASRLAAIEEDLDDLEVVMRDVEQGARLVQPRLRHRFQRDHIGLAHTYHRLTGAGTDLRFHVGHGPPLPQLLASVYAVADEPWARRRMVVDAIRRSFEWKGDLGPGFVGYLTGSDTPGIWIEAAGNSPRRWALDKLGIDHDEPNHSIVRRRFRDLLREAHPDHGGIVHEASDRIQELTEARRILLG